MRRLALIGLTPLILSALAGDVKDLAGKARLPNKEYAQPGVYRLVDDFAFGSGLATVLHGDFDINGHTFTMDTGGGNQTTFTGVISGAGTFVWNGGGNARWQTTPSFLRGDSANTFSGTLILQRGTLALAKPAGVDAVAGNIVIGGGGNQAILQLDASDQIADSASVQFVGPHEARIRTQGHRETLGALDLQTHGTIHLGDGESRLRFADSSGAGWDLTKTLTIYDWTDGKDTIAFGADSAGLTSEQLGRIGFDTPSDRAPGLYTAKALTDGAIAPDKQVMPIDPPFDLSEGAREERKKLYEAPGRDLLSGDGTPLKNGMTISFFGDSITWQNAFITRIAKALGDGAGTKGMTIRLVNRGINGGGVLSVRDGSDKAAYVDAKNRNGAQAAFADVIAADNSDVAVVYIGINDVWWRKTDPALFEQSLKDIIASARAKGTVPVLATLAVWGEAADNRKAKCDQFADITRKVAAETQTTLVDLRAAFMAYHMNHGASLRVDGSVVCAGKLLTYDGVHPNATGNDLLADQIARGVFRALAQ